MVDLKAWLSLHPLAATLLGWLVLSLLLWAFRPRTNAEYDKLPPRVSAFLQLLRGLFGDGAKIIEAARKVFSGKSLPMHKVGPAHLEYLTERLPPALGFGTQIDGREYVDRTDQRGAASMGGMLAGLGLAGIGLLCAWLGACTPHAQAATAATITKAEAARISYNAAILKCARDHSSNCAAFDFCQREQSRARGLVDIETHCEEKTRAEAVDAGLLSADGGL